MANVASTFYDRVKTELAAGLAAGYSGISVTKGIWHPGKLPAITRYGIVVSPSPNPWVENVVGVRNIQYILTADLYLLVKNYDETNSVFGDTAPNLGTLQLINDVKVLLRATNLSGLLDRTYSEVAGPLAIEYFAASGFDSGEHSVIRRAKLTYTGRLTPFCVTP